MKMDDMKKGLLDHIDGLTPVSPDTFADFKRAMDQEVIPEIVRVVEERRLAAAESRHWQLKC
ncbi:MAG: hypothetical protein EG825_05865 [Rhodocyclaceae bacterium]|nr:hypothetical protein [Rhodocyclaceae bacterium]